MSNARDKANIPALNFSSTGIDDNATSTAITINSSERVGIGTASPSRILTVYNDEQYEGILVKGNNHKLNQIESLNGNKQVLQVFKSGSGNYNIGLNVDNSFTFTDGLVNTERMRITSSGNVGIGTSSPSGIGSDTALEIAGSVSPGLVINDTGQAEKYQLYADSTKFKMSYGTTGFFTYDASNGNLGIGTVSPSTILEVSGSSGLASGSGTTNALRIADVGSGSSWSTTQDFSQLQFSSTDITAPGGSGVRFSIGVVSANAAHTYSNLTFRNYDGTEHMRIDGSNGNVGIGTSSPSQKLDVVGSIEVSDGIYIGGTGTANKLDDYEEGTWTAQYVPASGSITMFYKTGKYVKIGQLVFCEAALSCNGSSSPTGALYISGLPFTANGTSGNWSEKGGGGTCFPGQAFPDDQTNLFVKSGDTIAYIYDDSGNYLDASELNYTYNVSRVSISFTYRTDA